MRPVDLPKSDGCSTAQGIEQISFTAEELAKDSDAVEAIEVNRQVEALEREFQDLKSRAFADDADEFCAWRNLAVKAEQMERCSQAARLRCERKAGEMLAALRLIARRLKRTGNDPERKHKRRLPRK